MGTPTKWGQEIPVNTTTQSTQDQPKIEALANGRFVAAWRDISATGGDTSGQAVRAQMFNADGSKFGSEFVVNTVTANDQSEPDIIALSDGRYLITWKAFYAAGTGPLDTSQSAIAAQLFDANGGRVGGEFLVNTTTFAAQNTPAGAAFANGRFVLSWIDFSGTGDTAPGGIRAQLFEANGSKFGAEFLVNSTTVGNQVYPSVAVLADGNFVAAWTDGSHVAPDTSSFAIRARIFNSVGIPYGPDFVVNTTTQGEQLSPNVVALTGGRFVVTWSDFSKTGADTAGYAVRAQVFNSDGSRSGSEFLVNTTTENDELLGVFAPLPDGRFVAAWLEVAGGHGVVKAQVFNYNGSKSGDEFTAGTGDSVYLSTPSISTLPDGRFVVTFNMDTDGSSAGINAQIIDPREGQVYLTGTALDDQYVGTRFDDVLQGAAGVDRHWGENGNDTLVGGPSGDILNGGPGHDTASYANSAAGVLVDLSDSSQNAGGDAKGDVLVNVENVLGSIYVDVLRGDGNDNALSGLGGHDVLKGGGGNDLLVGGFGDDGLDGGDGDDTAAYTQDFDRYWIVEDATGKYLNVFGPEGNDELKGVEHLQFNDGRIDLADGNALFDPLYYMQQSPDVYRAGVDAFAHFNVHGWREGRDPNRYFDSSGYLAVNKDVASTGGNPLDHYHQTGWREGRDPSAWFDTGIYLARNPDIAAAGIDPLEHFLAFGRAEGRKAHAAIGPTIVGGFDAQYYLLQNTDVAAAGVDPLAHFELFGWREGRNPNAWFDTIGYLAHYADVAAAGINPLEHYRIFGWQEGRDPSYQFDTQKYLVGNPDVDAAHVDPLEHFLLFGAIEGRAANAGGWL